ncbi:crossover junction endodeoxyribonuclease RuvC [Solemya pervernicosa gill symbiont]|uniref:Crossover junction endodeoxyribonuclease RuvC n=2 Tax=Gammaproteobacteria incertae sedis TaxID=118884 RepID=A0A1T2L503_9GAMM|nr:crossover junction endodeoxyribonuclease RuvC [Candidatus Reidiella endopervernicosa]OOZ40120.1 crossover junction endodeoxyribonuclease RuvC [Solemya pervernicosa gill symbiont]QKQ27470.1 crossover junction endodeoxyribonuclease RuvC [Candidatus Reidiella endopervernicosa]
MTRILGIDPGSRITGFGIIETEGMKSRHIASGHLKIKGDSLPERLKQIFDGVSEVLAEFSPDEMAIEKVFMARNADSALKLGQARGAAICAGVTHDLTVSEYSPTQIKQAVVGTGRADKAQVQHMVAQILSIAEKLQADQADALAIALCHGHTSKTMLNIPTARSRRGGRWR